MAGPASTTYGAQRRNLRRTACAELPVSGESRSRSPENAPESGWCSRANAEPGAEPRGVVLTDDDLAGRRRGELDQQLALGVRPEPGDRGGAHQVLAVDVEELGGVAAWR
jgi:hypothetical protein